ncbi:hypothetical protein D3C78_819310 [compost metagenome]
MLLEQIQRVLDLRCDIPGRGQRVLLRGDLRQEVRVGIGRCQHLMHFPQAPAQHTGEIFQFDERVVVLLLLGHGVGQFIAQRPFEVVLRPFPGIALIVQVALGDHQQVVCTRPVPAHHGPQQWRDIAEPGCGQTGAHFQFRMHAAGDLADQLEHHAVADHHRAVGLFRRQVAHRRLRVEAEFFQFGGGLEANVAIAAGQYGASLNPLQYGMHEGLQAEGIGDQADLASAPYPRQRQLLRQRRTDLILGDKAERQLIATALATAGDIDLTEQHRMLRIAEAHAVGQIDLLDGGVLAGEPATILQPAGQDALLKDVA